MSEKIYYDERGFDVCKKDRFYRSLFNGIFVSLFMFGFFLGFYVLISTRKLILLIVLGFALLWGSVFFYFFQLPFSGTKIGKNHFWIAGRKFDYDNVDRIELVYEIPSDSALGPTIAYVVLNRPKLELLSTAKKFPIRGEGKERPLLSKNIAHIQKPVKFFKILKKKKNIPIVDKRDSDQKEIWPDPV